MIKEFIGIILVVGVAIPIASGVVSSTSTTTYGSLNESFNGTASTAYTPAHYLVSVNSFYNATWLSSTNTTVLYGANGTRTLPAIQTPLRDIQYNLTITSDDPAVSGDNVNVSLNGNHLGNLTGVTTTFKINSTSMVTTPASTLTFTYTVGNYTNITRMELDYEFWNATNSSYYSIGSGQFTPNYTGVYYLNYNYGATQSGVVAIIFGLIPVLLAVFGILFVANWIHD